MTGVARVTKVMVPLQETRWRRRHRTRHWSKSRRYRVSSYCQSLIIKMPPKKSNKESAKDANVLLLGRVGTSLKIGIVGLPNVGWVSCCCLRWTQNWHQVMSLHHQQKINLLQCLDKVDGSCRELPILYHWSQWVSCSSPWCQVWLLGWLL